MGFISIEQSDNLFWLGRYAERVYRTIRCFEALCDVMLDIDEQARSEERRVGKEC